MNYSKYLCVAVLACALVSPALAEKPGHAGKQKMAHEKVSWDKNDHNNKVMVKFGGENRSVIQSYLKRNYGKSCPPGLAKKNNGCLPPGQAKKYSVGGVLPRGYGNLPRDLADLLGTPPSGAYYAMVDKDVLLVSEGSKKILDAVTLLSAVSR